MELDQDPWALLHRETYLHGFSILLASTIIFYSSTCLTFLCSSILVSRTCAGIKIAKATLLAKMHSQSIKLMREESTRYSMSIDI